MANPYAYARRRRNAGQDSLRQRMAPQPDSGRGMFGWGNRTPQQVMRQQGARMGVPNHPAGPVGNAANYTDFLDRLNPGVDAPIDGLSPQMVKWMKRNLLGRDGKVSGRAGGRFRNQLNSYIGDAGGTQPFMQMLGAMPGYGKRMAPFAGNGSGRPRREARQANAGPGQQPQQPQPIQQPQQQSPWNQWGPAGNQGQIPQHPQQQQQQQPNTAKGQAFQEQQQQGGLMFPRQAQQMGMGPVGGQQQPQGGQQQGGGGMGQMNGGGHQQQGGGGKGAAQKAQELVSDPGNMALAQHYGGNTDPKAQRAQDRKFFAERGIPLTPELEEGMRLLSDEYLRTMIALGYREADAAAMLALEKERLASKYGDARAAADRSAAARGMFNSGTRLAEQEDVREGFGRAYQDLGLQHMAELRDIANAKAEAAQALQHGKQELALAVTGDQVAKAMEGDIFTGLPTGRRRGRRRTRRRNG